MIYLASPYSNGDKELNYKRVSDIMAWLFYNKKDKTFYSPICSWHHIAKEHSIKGNYEIFRRIDEAAIASCFGFAYCVMPGHRESSGMKSELAYAISRLKTYFILRPSYVDPFSMELKHVAVMRLQSSQDLLFTLHTTT